MSEEIYLKLAKALDGMPGGFPATEKGTEIKILKKLFTPEQAELAMKLKPGPETVSAIASRIGEDKDRLAEKLESMAKLGLIYRVRTPGGPLYMSIQFAVGIYEFSLNRMDKELAELMDEYILILGKSWMKTATRQLRVVPVANSIESAPAVASYDQIRNLVKEQEMIAVAPCICRKEKAVLGHKCDRPEDLCFTFGLAADFYIENGMGRKIDAAEALRLLDVAEKHALVLSPTNSEKIMNICCCCKCCCGVLHGLSQFEKPAELVHSSFQAKIDADSCSGCASCVERCQIDAIDEDGDVYKINADRCIGCGLCVSVCPTESIAMIAKPVPHKPPETMLHMMMKIAQERSALK